MKRKALGLFLAAVMTMSLMACGSKEPDPAVEEPATEEPAAEAEENVDAPTSQGGEVLKIGLVAAITGTEPLEGERMVQGLELALEEYNASGGVNGIQIEFEIQDSQGTTDGMLNAAQKLVADGCQILLGPQKSSHVMAIGDTMDEAKVPFIAGGTSPKLQGAYEYLFTCRTNDIYMASIAAQACKETFDAKKVGVFYVSDDFGTGGLGVAEEYFKNNGIECVSEAYNSGDADVSGQILSLQNADVDCVMMWGHGVDLPVISRTMGQLGWDKPVIASSGAALQMYLDLCEPEWLEDWYAVAEYADTSTEEIVQQYAKNFKEATGEAGELYGATYYGAFQAVVAALENGAEPTSESLYNALKEIENVPGILGSLTCDGDQFLMHDALLVQIKDLVPQVVDSFTAEF